MTDFEVLRCPSCGGALDVYKDMQTFCCGYCNSPVAAVRRGGTVSLSLEASIQSVETNTGKTAAELALRRLEKERKEAIAWLASLEEASNSFRPQDLMPALEAGAAEAAAGRLREEVRATRSLIPIVGTTLIVLFSRRS